jgi:isopentenyl phosphate kinase
MKPLIILKIGGSVITDKHSEEPKMNRGNLDRIAKEISEGYNPDKMSLIILHGAGSYGHQIVKKTGIDRGISAKQQLVDFAETQRLQNELNCIVSGALIKNGLPAMPCQASASAVMDGKKLVAMDTEAIKGFLEIGLIPALYGVPAYDRKQKCSILSGDEIAPYLAKELKAQKIIHGTDVDGIFTADPKKDRDAKLIPLVTEKNFEEVKKSLSGSSAVDVTGGMMKKVSELMSIAEEGIESQIVNACVEGNVKMALAGETFGTIVKLK